MNDPKTDDKPTAEGSVKFEDIKSVVKELVDDAIGKLTNKNNEPTTSESSTDSPLSIKQEVQRALAEIHKGDTEKQERETAESRLKAVEEKVAERQPVERRKVHKVMGWGD